MPMVVGTRIIYLRSLPILELDQFAMDFSINPDRDGR